LTVKKYKIGSRCEYNNNRVREHINTVGVSPNYFFHLLQQTSKLLITDNENIKKKQCLHENSIFIKFIFKIENIKIWLQRK
jgi:type V secretory pathway adhesin AidA